MFWVTMRLGAWTLLIITLMSPVALQESAAQDDTTNNVSTALIVQNPLHLYVSEDRAKVLLHATCRVLQKEYRLRHSLENAFRLKLVLGEPDERVIFAPVGDDKGVLPTESSRLPTIYMQQWDEAKFVTASLRVAVWEIVNDKDEVRIVQQILNQAAAESPISVQALRYGPQKMEKRIK